MDGKKKLEELVAGLDGVTTGFGRWIRLFGDRTVYTRDPQDGCRIRAVVRADDPGQNAVLDHIARCDPDTIRSISDAYKAMEAERDALRAEAGELVVAQYRISALETAITRQVKNIERWIETGEPASPEESKSIYEQLKSALEARHEG